MPRGVPKAGFRMTKNRKQAAAGVTTARLTPPVAEVSTESDADIARKLTERFDIIDIMATSACHSSTRALIVSGPAGLGKSYAIERAVEAYDPDESRTLIVKGFMRPTGLYKTLHQYRFPGNVVIFDDCDSIFFDTDALNLLKAACDTTDRRRICWGAETRMTDDEGNLLPTSFEFEGSIIFITNYDFDYAIYSGHRLAEHFEAMISRAHYIDTGMKSTRDYLIRIKQVVDSGMLRSRGLTEDDEKVVLDFLFKNSDKMRELTLRAVVKMANLYLANRARWTDIAKVTMFKSK